jgi:hypothetical protein
MEPKKIGGNELKKLVVLLLLGFTVALGFMSSAKAAEGDLIDLYPYDQVACLDSLPSCTQTKLGNSNWDFEYYGHRYHIVRGSARYVKDFTDANSDGFISALEMPTMSWNAFASLIINDTDESVILSTNNVRTDLTSVVHRIYSYFDEDGQLQMFEDHINTYYIFNDGSDATPANANWRLATQAEIDAYIAAAADAKPVTTRLAYIRMALNDTDSNGYVIEPIKYLTWTNVDVNTAVDLNVENWSTIIVGNPNYVGIPAGWTIVSFGTNDRGTFNTKTRDYIKTLPIAMLDDTVAPFKTVYTPQPAIFTGLTALDDDLVTPGVNIVVNYNDDFDLDPTVTASWINMFDTEGKIINSTDKLDYEVTISQNDVDLQTITFTYDTGTSAYIASGPVTVIDSSVFGSGYKATYTVETPEEDVTIATLDIVIGVMPPKFAGIANRYINEGVYIDLLEGVTADDGYGNSKTNDIEVSFPAGFNQYNPLPGMYEIDLSFTHHVHFDGVQSKVIFKGVTTVNFNEQTALNATTGIDILPSLQVFTEITNFTTATTAFGSVMVVVAANGTMKERYDRNNWEYTTSTGTIVGDANTFAAWKAALTLAPGEFIVTAHGSTHSPVLRAAALAFGDTVALTIGYPAFDYDIVTESSYMLTVDDTTAPLLVVVNQNYKVERNTYTTINQAILANVVAFDYTDDYEDLSIYVSNNGGMVLVPGVYTVEVTVEDAAGNSTSQTFTVTVTPAKLTLQEIQALLDAQTITEAEIQAMIDAQTITAAEAQALLDAQALTEAEIQALIDASIPETGCGSSINLGSSLMITLSLVLGAALVFVFKRRR